MKTSYKFMLIPMIMLMLTSNAFADGKTEKRNSCFVLKRYVAEAKIKDPDSPYWINDEEKKCSGTAYAFVSAQDYCGGAGPYVAAEVEAQSSAAGESYTEYTLGCTGWTAGSDVNHILPLHSDFAMFRNKTAAENSGSFISRGRIAFGDVLFNESNSEIIIKDLRGFLAVNSQDIYNDYSTFVINIKYYNSDETYQIIKQSRAFIYKGQLVVEGDLNKSLFTAEKLSNGNKYALYVPELKIDLHDQSLIWENLAVELAIDGGNLGNGIAKEYAIDFNSAQVKEIDKLHQPSAYRFDATQTVDYNALTLTMMNSTDEAGSINIYGIDGKLIKNLEPSIQLTKDIIVHSYDVSDLITGIYFVTFESQNILLTRKISIVR